MSVERRDLNACIGCRFCNQICPMDVFRFDEKAMKSVIAYAENCQSCGQCFVNCPGRSLMLSNTMFGYAITAHRATTTAHNAASPVTPSRSRVDRSALER